MLSTLGGQRADFTVFKDTPAAKSRPHSVQHGSSETASVSDESLCQPVSSDRLLTLFRMEETPRRHSSETPAETPGSSAQTRGNSGGGKSRTLSNLALGSPLVPPVSAKRNRTPLKPHNAEDDKEKYHWKKGHTGGWDTDACHAGMHAEESAQSGRAERSRGGLRAGHRCRRGSWVDVTEAIKAGPGRQEAGSCAGIPGGMLRHSLSICWTVA